ncbi:hypothetical protein PYCC9005_005188 [Savitreella phatthalungensis]
MLAGVKSQLNTRHHNWDVFFARAAAVSIAFIIVARVGGILCDRLALKQPGSDEPPTMR